MGEILPFPTEHVRSWAVCEGAIRKVLKGAGASGEMTTHVCERMKEFYDLLRFDMNVSLQIPVANADVAQDLETQWSLFVKNLQGRNAELLMDRLIVEVELYKLRRDAGLA